jgi:hypothetical protein
LCWFVLREKYCWLVVGGWFVLREKYCWLVADKPSEQASFQMLLCALLERAYTVTIVLASTASTHNTTTNVYTPAAMHPVRLAYQLPVSSSFLSEQISHQQPASSTFLSEQISTSHQPPAKRNP